uniref:Uncharacterized protein n=1 Tax=Theropithecus gelada TaxID=9565 RepID=A0A8D2JVX0_THEGE
MLCIQFLPFICFLECHLLHKLTLCLRTIIKGFLTSLPNSAFQRPQMQVFLDWRVGKTPELMLSQVILFCIYVHTFSLNFRCLLVKLPPPGYREPQIISTRIIFIELTLCQS